MKRAEHIEEGPNIAGISLALYLLVSLLSMMAAYEVGRAPDDVRNSVVFTLQSSCNAPNKSGDDDDHKDLLLVPAAAPVELALRPLADRAPVYACYSVSVSTGFNPRAPPVLQTSAT